MEGTSETLGPADLSRLKTERIKPQNVRDRKSVRKKGCHKNARNLRSTSYVRRRMENGYPEQLLPPTEQATYKSKAETRMQK